MKKLLLSCAAVMAVSMASAQGWQKPVYSGGFQPLTLEQPVYVYNVEAQQFLTEGNDWGTHASVGATGLLCMVETAVPPTDDSSTEPEWDGKTYNIKVKSVAKGGWNDLFITDGGNLYVDRGSQADYFFSFTDLGNNTYNIYGADSNPVYNHSGDYASYLVGHYTLYTDVKNGVDTGTGVIYGDTGVDSEFEPGTFHTTWAFVSEDDYAAYCGQITAYQAAEELKTLIDEAKQMGVDTSEAEAAYANTAAAAEELRAAIDALNAKVLAYYETSVTPSNPKDLTYMIVNATGDNTSGWSRPAGAGTWENANMSAGWQTGWEEGAFEGSYLNIWGASIDAPISQAFSGLPNGIYVVRLSVLAQKDGAYVFANEVVKPVPADETGRAYSITVEVNDGTLEFGIKQEPAGTNWLCLDNASLMYYGSGVEAYRHWLNGLLESAPSFDGATVQTALLAEYEAVLASVNTVQTKEEILGIIPAYEDVLERIKANMEAYAELEAAQREAEDIAAQANEYYSATVGDYILENVQPVLDEHTLGTAEVGEVIKALKDAAAEAQSYIWNMEKLAAEVEKALAIFEEYNLTCSPEAEAAYIAFVAKYEALDSSMLKNAEVEAMLEELYSIEFELQKGTEPASDEHPIDYTAKIYNPSFVGVDGWTNEGWGTFSNNTWYGFANEEGATDGSGEYLNLYIEGSSANGYQNIAGLPAGAYTLTFGAYADQEGLQVYADDQYVDIPVGQNELGYMRLYHIDFIVSEAAVLPRIGVRYVGTTKMWAMVDEFRLAYKGTDSEIFASISASSSAAAVPAAVYTVSGARVKSLSRGINIVRMSDGTVRKVMVK